MAGLLLYRELEIEDRLPPAGLQELHREIQALSVDRFGLYVGLLCVNGCPGSSVLLGDSLTTFHMLKYT